MKNYLSVLLFFVGGCLGECQAQVVRLYVEKDATLSSGSAFYVGKTEDGNSVFVTAKHVLEDGQAQVLFRGQKYPVLNATLDSTEDVAVFEAALDIPKGILLTEHAQQGEELELPGFGPCLQGKADGVVVRTAVTTTCVGVARMRNGVIISGDSGCPAVTCRGAIGVVVGYDRDDRTATVIVPTRYIKRCLSKRYVEVQCGPNGCPIYIRPRMQQPMFGVAIPVGPPTIYHEAVPVPRKPQVYVPQPQEPQNQETVQGPKGDPGPRGEQGPKGDPGRSVTQDQVESIVNAWLDANVEQLRGERGPKGDSGDTADVEALERRVSSIEKRKFRIQIRNGDKVVDDETFLLSEMESDPVILDINKLRTNSGN